MRPRVFDAAVKRLMSGRERSTKHAGCAGKEVRSNREDTARSFASVVDSNERNGYETIIGIGGGVGPMAGVMAHQKVIEWTATDGTDWDHLEVHHLSRSHDIVGRPAFINGTEKRNPGEGMARTVQALSAAASTLNKRVVVGVPCNTFHHEAIWARYKKLSLKCDNVKLLHLLEEAARYMVELIPHLKSVGVLCTTASKEAKIFEPTLSAQGITPVYLNVESQDQLQECISNPEWGLKAVYPPSARAVSMVQRLCNKLQAQGVEALLLGCTEMPLALQGSEYEGTPLINPIDALARALIREVDPGKVKPLRSAACGGS